MAAGSQLNRARGIKSSPRGVACELGCRRKGARLAAESKFTPEYWRARAEEIRTKLEGMKLESVRQTLIQIAETYDRMAERAEAKTPRSRERE